VEGWRWERRQGLPLLHLSLGAAQLAFSSRWGGVSEPPFHTLNLSLTVGDDPGRVRENRRRVLQALGFPEERVVTAQQVHGARVAVVTEQDGGRGMGQGRGAVEGTDALVTAEKGLVLWLGFADCVPVYLVDPVHQAVGLCHAGWRGVAAGVVEATMTSMTKHFGSRPQDLAVALGPCVGPSYRVGPEVRGALGQRYPWIEAYVDAQGVLDLAGLVERVLVEQGVARERVYPTCERTESPAFFSYRAEGGRTGRMAALLWMA
jgi:YfiH family protein